MIPPGITELGIGFLQGGPKMRGGGVMAKRLWFLACLFLGFLWLSCDSSATDVCEYVGQSCRRSDSGAICTGTCKSRCTMKDPPPECLYCETGSCVSTGDCEPDPSGNPADTIPLAAGLLVLVAWRCGVGGRRP